MKKQNKTKQKKTRFDLNLLPQIFARIQNGWIMNLPGISTLIEWNKKV